MRRVQKDEMWGGSKGPVDRRIEEARLLKEVPHLGGMEEVGDRTREAG